MIKFFRKHNKRLLVIVTILAMVSFVGGSALVTLLAPDRAGVQIGVAYGETINEGERIEVERQTRLLSQLGYPWQAPWRLAGGGMPPLDVLDYLLLLREADKAGVRPSLEQAHSELAGRGINLTNFSLNTKASTKEIVASVANYLTVMQLWSTAQQSMMSTELEVHRAVRRQYEKIGIAAVQIDSATLLDSEGDVPEEILLAHYEERKDREPGAGALEFGYLIPERLRVEYLTINTASIQLKQPITTKQAETFWRENKNEFRRPAAEDVEGPTPSDSPIYATFEEAKADVFDRLTALARLEEGRRMAAVLWEALREPWYNRPQGDDGFPLPPEGAEQDSYLRSLINSLGAEAKHPQAIGFGRTELFSKEDAGSQLPIGGARVDTQSSGRGNRFGQTLEMIQGLVSAEQLEANRSAGLARYEPAPVTLIDDDSNLYIYRVVEALAKHTPDSLAEVREAVIADVRRLNAFQAAADHAAAIKAQTGTRTLQEVWDAGAELDDDTRTTCCFYFESEPFPQVEEIIPGFRFPVQVRETAASAAARGLSAHQFRSDEFVEQVYELLQSEGDSSVGVIEVPTMEKCFVVQLTGLEHVTKTEYEAISERLRLTVARDRLMTLEREWFSPDRIRDRTDFDFAS